MAKRALVAYALWLAFGWWGAHLLYLRRARHAFVTFATWGGFFGYGWLSDAWHIPRYVRHANLSDREYERAIKDLERKSKKPPFKWTRTFAQLTFGYILGYLVLAAIPVEPIFGYQLYNFLFWLMPVAVALGVHTCGNIGAQQGELKWALYGALAASAVAFAFDSLHGWAPIISTSFFNWKGKKWHHKRSDHRLLFQLAALFGCSILYYSLFASYLYFNAELQDNNGETIKLRDSIGNFFKSPMWIELKESLIQLRNYAKVHGWRKMWQEFIEKMDPQGEKTSLKVLELEANASQEEIHKRYKELSRMWHPDKHRSPQDKAAAQEKFMEIKQAYERLSKITQRRREKNKWAQHAT